MSRTRNFIKIKGGNTTGRECVLAPASIHASGTLATARVSALRFAAYPGYHLLKFRERLFQLYTQNASPCVQNPIVFRADDVQLSPAQSKTFPQQPFGPVAVVRLADRLFGSRYADAMPFQFRGQNENRHKTAFKTLPVLVNPKEIHALQ